MIYKLKYSRTFPMNLHIKVSIRLFMTKQNTIFPRTGLKPISTRISILM